MKRNIFKILLRRGIQRIIKYAAHPLDINPENTKIYEFVKPYTMTSVERVSALVDAVNYLEANSVEGAFVECGVWKGGSTMAMLLALKSLGKKTRDVYLYDTFSGMTSPQEVDISINGEDAQKSFIQKKTSNDASNWSLSSLEEVKKNLNLLEYPENKLFFIEGKVEDTIPRLAPKKIALLRLDTDWYESTKHELVHLFPLLQPNGVLIIDDYGYWQGAKKAVDEFISDNKIRILLNRIDESGRLGIKIGD